MIESGIGENFKNHQIGLKNHPLRGDFHPALKR
jgi:hypothetical protein